MSNKASRSKPLEVSGLRERKSRSVWPWLLVPALGAGGYVAAKVATDPGRSWASQIESQRRDTLQAALGKCFGGTDGTAVRAAANTVGAGQWPSTLNNCRGEALTGLVSAPAQLAAKLTQAPSKASVDAQHETQSLAALTASLQRLSQVIEAHKPDATREDSDRAARALVEVAAMLDQETSSFNRMKSSASALKLW